MLGVIKRIGYGLLLTAVGVLGGMTFPAAYKGTVEYLNAPPAPASAAGQALIECIQQTDEWRIALTGNAIVNQTRGLIVHLNKSGRDVVRRWDADYEKNDLDTKCVEWFESTDYLHIREAAKKTKSKLVLKEFGVYNSK